MHVNILAVGDVVGAPGLDFLCHRLRSLIRLKQIAFTVVNGENAALRGLTPADAEDIFSAGADVITLGNHTFGKSAIQPYLDDCPRILRPANLAPQNPGRGWGDFETSFGPVRVVNLIGRCGMDFHPDNPFLEMDRILKKDPPVVILTDMHAEATSEKLAMGYYLDGRVSAVWGTHTHVQTSDAGVLPKKTGYITDLGTRLRPGHASWSAPFLRLIRPAAAAAVWKRCGLQNENGKTGGLCSPPACIGESYGPQNFACGRFSYGFAL